ncbi:hypothetical protein GCM10009759_38210 [Kitasatospora saccharophila]|uniref:DUF3800 domain-containing protein n=1 Tax=Kitasatospora saccharophila TaxID=407973 RepID=A0ABN2X1Z0_9ACTN
MSPDARNRTAWSDESFQEENSSGFYIIAAAVIEPGAEEGARDTMRALRCRGGRADRKLHWTEMDHRQRTDAARAVASLQGLHVVTFGAPVPVRRQERARAKCLAELVAGLHGLGVDRLYVEAREPSLNERDVRTVMAARRTLPTGSAFRVEHVHGGNEPLLWIADVVAGARRFAQFGRDEYWQRFGDSAVEVDVVTDC